MQKLRRNATIGAILIAGMGFAFLFNGFGLGPGNGAGDGPGTGTGETEQLDMDDVAADTQPNVPLVPDVQTTETERPDTSDVVTVIVEEKRYLWATNDIKPEKVEPISLEEIVSKAKASSGNEEGVRARIFRAGSALPSAENNLLDALKQAGLAETEIDFEQSILEIY